MIWISLVCLFHKWRYNGRTNISDSEFRRIIDRVRAVTFRAARNAGDAFITRSEKCTPSDFITRTCCTFEVFKLKTKKMFSYSRPPSILTHFDLRLLWKQTGGILGIDCGFLNTRINVLSCEIHHFVVLLLIPPAGGGANILRHPVLLGYTKAAVMAPLH